MSNDYFDTFTDLPRDQLARAEAVNAIFQAVVVGFDKLPDVILLQQDRISYCADTGAANAYVITPTFPILAYIEGQRFSFKAVHGNNGASTINVSGLGNKAILKADGTNVGVNDIIAGRIVSVEYDGTAFQLMSQAGSESAALQAAVAASAATATAAAASATASAGASAASAANSNASAVAAAASLATIQSAISPWAVAGGTANAITAAFTPTVTSLLDGQVLSFRALLANTTTTPTFQADATTARVITKRGGAALAVGDIPAPAAECIVRYNLANTRWELLNAARPAVLTTADIGGAGTGITTDVVISAAAASGIPTKPTIWFQI